MLPRTPSFTEIKAGATEINGVVDPGAVVNVVLDRDNQQSDFTTTADEEGNFRISLVDDDGNKITIKLGARFIRTSTLKDIELSSEAVEITVFTR
ncbi:hypothetical protein ACTPL8_002698 [Enterococcus faecium]